MRRTQLAAVVGCAAALSGCGLDALPDDKADYAGSWTGETIELQIGSDASVDYQRNTMESSSSISGKIQRFEGDDFVVYAVFNFSFDVGETPHEDAEGVLRMTVNGEELSQ